MAVHRIEDAWGDVNLDHYPVEVTTLPSQDGRVMSPEELLAEIRLDLNHRHAQLPRLGQSG